MHHHPRYNMKNLRQIPEIQQRYAVEVYDRYRCCTNCLGLTRPLDPEIDRVDL